MRLATVFAAAAAFLVVATVQAQGYPAKPVRIIVPFSPGGATDIVTRILGQKLTEVWGQTVVVDNRAGAGGNIGGELAAKSPPDGYTLFMTSGSIVTANPYMYKQMGFNPDKELMAVINVASGPQVVAVYSSLPAKNVKELIVFAKARPRSIIYGSAGFGTQVHLAAENFLYTAGIDGVHAPYKGEAPALTDLVSGQIQLLTPNLAAALGFVQQGRIRALGVTSKQRFSLLPNVPAVAETLPGFENLGWFGLMAPAGTPNAVIDKVYQDTAKALNSPDIRKRFGDIGMAPVGNRPDELAAAIKQESQKWAKIIRERKLQIQ